MSLVITGATGHLGRLVVESLLQQGVPAQDIVAADSATTTIAGQLPGAALRACVAQSARFPSPSRKASDAVGPAR